MANSVVHFHGIKSAILTELRQAKYTVQIAVAWFTDQELFAALLQLAARKVAVTLLIRNDYVNNRADSLPWQHFIEQGGLLYFDNIGQLHHKFCLIDNARLLSGSYNWTHLAEQRNQENCVFTAEPGLITQFSQEFQRITASFTPETAPARVARPTAPEEAYLISYAAADQTLTRTPAPALAPTPAPTLTVDEVAEQGMAAALHMRYPEAIELFLQVLAQQPDRKDIIENLALGYLYRNKLADVIKVGKQAEKGGLANAGTYATMGQAYALLGDTDVALQYFDKSIRLRPWSSIALYYKWQTLDDAGRKTEAEKYRRELLTTTRDAIIRPHKHQDAVDLFHHHIHRALLYKDGPNALKSAQAAQLIYTDLPIAQKDIRFQQMLNELIK